MTRSPLRPPAVRSLRLALLYLGVAALALAGTAIALFSPAAGPFWLLIVFALVGLEYVAAGILAWAQRPSNRIGALLCLGGFALLFSTAINTDVAALVTVGYVTAALPLAVIGHMLLAFPSGRLGDRYSRALAIAAYFPSVVLQAPSYLFSGDPRLPAALRIADRPDVRDAFHWAQSGTASGLVALFSILLGARFLRANPAQRRVLAWLYPYGVFTFLFVVLSANVVRPLTGLDPITLFELQIGALAGVPVAFALAVLSGGFARTGEIEELGAWLGGSEERRPGLREALRSTLGDPSLDLLLWLRDAGRYVDESGRPAELSPRSGRAAVEVTVAGELVGAIEYDPALNADPELVRAASRVVALALERERLTAELRASRDALSESRARIVEAGDLERRRIARDLHDGLQGRLVVLAMTSSALGADGAALRAGLEEAIAELRRLVHGVMPALLIERGLYAATEELADRVPLPVALDLADGDGRLPPTTETAGYFVVAEALANAVKHAHASRLSVRLARCNEHLEIEVHDDGVGGARLDRGTGLRGIADRVDALGGRLHLHSPPGSGTVLRAEIPCVS